MQPNRLGHVALITLAFFAAFAPAQAAPVHYAITFDGSNTAAGAMLFSGTGSFDYDAATNPGTMTNLVWNFGSGHTGGLTNAFLATGGIGETLFLSILQNSGNPATSGVRIGPASEGLIAPFPNVAWVFCWGLSSGSCGMMNPLTATGSYDFIDFQVGGDVHYRGYLTEILASASVPEPATLALLGLGLAGIGFSRRKQ